jgi:hypothetical protein
LHPIIYHEVPQRLDLSKHDEIVRSRRLRGGTEQDPILPGRTSIKLPANYPPDLCWKGQQPKEEYNYVVVDVKPGEKTKFTLNRFRPWSAEPFASVSCLTLLNKKKHDMRVSYVLSLPRFVLQPITCAVIAVVHVYLASEHLSCTAGRVIDCQPFSIENYSKLILVKTLL